jgi:hypothetical protein
MCDLDHKLRLRSKVMREREERCKLGLPCRNCCPPLPGLSIDALTMDLVKKGHLRATTMCPFQAVDDALLYFKLNRAMTRRETDAKFRSASRELAKALNAATESISKAINRANKILGIGTGHDLGWDIQQVLDDPWATVVRANTDLLAMMNIAEIEASEKPGRVGNTRRQSLVDGLLVAWERANGKMPDSGNIHFQAHLLAALKLVEPGYSDFDLVKAIRGAHDRICRRRQKKSSTIARDN